MKQEQGRFLRRKAIFYEDPALTPSKFYDESVISHDDLIMDNGALQSLFHWLKMA
jgi:hypothetical protein